MGPDNDIAALIAKWKESGGAERATFQSFIGELCDLLGVTKPGVGAHHRDYVFERDVTFRHPDGTTSPGRIDLYKRSCFVLEAKQGIEKDDALPALVRALPRPARHRKRSAAVRGTARWDALMMRARGQAEAYAKALPDDEGWPRWTPSGRCRSCSRSPIIRGSTARATPPCGSR